MRLKVGFAALIAVSAIGLSACGGKAPPPPPPVVPETVVATPNADSLAAAEAARYAAAANQLCVDARAAIANGDYERARRLLEQAVARLSRYRVRRLSSGTRAMPWPP